MHFQIIIRIIRSIRAARDNNLGFRIPSAQAKEQKNAAGRTCGMRKSRAKKPFYDLQAAGAFTGTPPVTNPLTTTKSKDVPRLACIITVEL
jgi:hypothetical protein